MMEEGIEKNENQERTVREEIFSKAVRAGKRTYFFDVKATRRNEYYLTITESKKRFSKEGKAFFEKHKVFLYREDFDKFMDGLKEVLEFIQREQPYVPEEEGYHEVHHEANHEANHEEQPKPADEMAEVAEVEEPVAEDFTNLEFEDLDDKKE
jgi:hypothetical protein